MSVKLPVLKSGTVKLLKGKTLPDDAEKHHGAFNRNTSSRLERTNNIKSRIKQPQNYSRDEDDQNASDTSTNLNKSRTVAVNNHPKAIINSSYTDQMTTYYHTSTVSFDELKLEYDKKVTIVDTLRKAIASKNKELKKIAEEVDKDLSAAMLKGLKSDRSLPIKDIFSAKKSSNESISFLHNELTKIRKNIKKAKEEVQRMDCSFKNPIFQNYQDRGLEYRTKLKEYETEIRYVEHEKSLISEYLRRVSQDVNIEEEHLREEYLLNLKETYNHIIAMQKYYKHQLYRIEKYDVFIMEKTTFLKQRTCDTQKKTYGHLTSSAKRIIEENMQSLVQYINNIIDSRNKTEIERKSKLKQLTVYVEEIYSENWEIFKRLRTSEAFLLQSYDLLSKSQNKVKEKAKLVSNIISVQQEQYKASFEVNPKLQHQTGTTSEFVCNKYIKNYKYYVILVEKKKIYEFGSFDKNNYNEVILKDYTNEIKGTISKLTLFVNYKTINGFTVSYRQKDDSIFNGYIIASKDRHNSKPIYLFLNHHAYYYISFISVGFTKHDYIASLRINTSYGNYICWYSTNKPIRNEKKTIRKYEYAYFKGKISLDYQNGSRINAFGLHTMYLENK